MKDLLNAKEKKWVTSKLLTHFRLGVAIFKCVSHMEAYGSVNMDPINTSPKIFWKHFFYLCAKLAVQLTDMEPL